MTQRRFAVLVSICLYPLAAAGQPTSTAKAETAIPIKILDVTPEYPAVAHSARVAGRVVGEVEIAPAGTVASARILCSIPLLDNAMLDAIRQWRYRPQRREANLRAIVTANFDLQFEDGTQLRREPCTPTEPPGVPVRAAPSTLTKIGGADPVPTPEQLRKSVVMSKRSDFVVIVEFDIAPEGFVYGARVIKSEPYLDQTVLDAVSTWTFAPPMVDGKPAAVLTLRSFKFQASPTPIAPRTDRPFVEEGSPDAAELAGIRNESIKAYRVGGAIKPPIKLKHAYPVFPQLALSARVEGILVLEAVIGREGRVLDARPLLLYEPGNRRSGGELLHAAAFAAIRQWRYTPTMVDGKAVPAIMTITLNFNSADPRLLALGAFESSAPADLPTQNLRFEAVSNHLPEARYAARGRLEQMGVAADGPRYAEATSWIDERLIVASLVKPRGTATLEFFSFAMLPASGRTLLAGLLIERDAFTSRRWNPDLFGALESVRTEYNRTISEYGLKRVEAALHAVRQRLRPSFMGSYFIPERAGDTVWNFFLRQIDPVKAAAEPPPPIPSPSRRGVPATTDPPPSRGVVSATGPRPAPSIAAADRTDLTSPTEGELAQLDMPERLITLTLRDGSSASFGFDDGTTVSALDGNARLLVRSEGRALDNVRAVRLQWTADAANPARRSILRITITAMR
jgi:TonB family protein